jgi:hypothetical protein
MRQGWHLLTLAHPARKRMDKAWVHGRYGVNWSNVRLRAGVDTWCYQQLSCLAASCGIQEQQKYELPTPERCLRAHILSLRAEIAYVDASAGLRTHTHTGLCLHEVLIAPFLLKMNNWVLNHLTLCDFLEIWMRFPCATMQGCPWPYINVDASSAGKSAGWGRGLNGTSSSEMPAEAVGSSDCSSDDACSMLRQGVWISSGIRVSQNFPVERHPTSWKDFHVRNLITWHLMSWQYHQRWWIAHRFDQWNLQALQCTISEFYVFRDCNIKITSPNFTQESEFGWNWYDSIPSSLNTSW